jgi:hypothetical protein
MVAPKFKVTQDPSQLDPVNPLALKGSIGAGKLPGLDQLREDWQAGNLVAAGGLERNFAPLNYFEAPQNVTKWYHKVFDNPATPAPSWVDSKTLKLAYDFLKYKNKDLPEDQWLPVTPEDPVAAMYGTMAAPPVDQLNSLEKQWYSSMQSIRTGQTGKEVQAQWMNKTFWLDPQRVVRYYNAVRTLPTNWQGPEWVSPTFLKQAYDVYKTYNKGLPTDQWKPLPKGNPGNQLLATGPVPPQETWAAWDQPKDNTLPVFGASDIIENSEYRTWYLAKQLQRQGLSPEEIEARLAPRLKQEKAFAEGQPRMPTNESMTAEGNALTVDMNPAEKPLPDFNKLHPWQQLIYSAIYPGRPGEMTGRSAGSRAAAAISQGVLPGLGVGAMVSTIASPAVGIPAGLLVFAGTAGQAYFSDKPIPVLSDIFGALAIGGQIPEAAAGLIAINAGEQDQLREEYKKKGFKFEGKTLFNDIGFDKSGNYVSLSEEITKRKKLNQLPDNAKLLSLKGEDALFSFNEQNAKWKISPGNILPKALNADIAAAGMLYETQSPVVVDLLFYPDRIDQYVKERGLKGPAALFAPGNKVSTADYIAKKAAPESLISYLRSYPARKANQVYIIGENVPTELEPDPWTGEIKMGTAAMVAARDKIIAGVPFDQVYADVSARYGLGGWMNDFMGQNVFNLLNLAPMAEARLTENVAMRVGAKDLAMYARAARGDFIADALPMPLNSLYSHIFHVESSKGFFQIVGEYHTIGRTGFQSMSHINMPSDMQEAYKMAVLEGADPHSFKFDGPEMTWKKLPTTEIPEPAEMKFTSQHGSYENVPGKKWSELTPLERRLLGINEEGRFAELEPAPDANWFVKLFKLEPDAQAAKFIENYHDAIQAIVSEYKGESIDELVKILKATAEADPKAIQRADRAFMDTPVIYTVADALKKGVEDPRLVDIVNQWHEIQNVSSYLNNLSLALEIEPGKIVEMINTEKGVTELAARVEALKSPAAEINQFSNPENIKKVLGVFAGEDALAWHPAQYVKKVMRVLTENVDTYLVEKYHIAPDPLGIRVSHLLKSTMSLFVLSNNVMYAMNNAINDVVSRAGAGVSGWVDPRIQREWLEEMGVTPYRYRVGVGFGGEREIDVITGREDFPPVSALYQAKRGGKVGIKIDTTKGAPVVSTELDFLAKAQDTVRAINNKFGMMTKLSNWIEKQESEQATFIGGLRFWDRNRKYGVGISPFPPELEAYLKDYPATRAVMIDALESGLNMDQVLTKMYTDPAAMQINIPDMVDEIATRRFPDEPGILKETLKETIGDQLNQLLPRAKSVQEINRIFDFIEANTDMLVDDWHGRILRARADEVATLSDSEQMLYIVDAHNELSRYIQNEWAIEHFNEIKDLYESTKDLTGRERTDAWRLQNTKDAARFNVVKERHLATLEGIFRKLNVNDPDEALIVTSTRGIYDLWSKFYERSQEKRARFFRTDYSTKEARKTAYYTMELEIQEDYKDTYFGNAEKGIQGEQGLNQQIDNVMANIYAQRTGSPREDFLTWRQDVTNVRDYMAQAQIAARSKAMDAETPAARYDLLDQFFDKEYRKLVDKLEETKRNGARKLFDKNKDKVPEPVKVETAETAEMVSIVEADNIKKTTQKETAAAVDAAEIKSKAIQNRKMFKEAVLQKAPHIPPREMTAAMAIFDIWIENNWLPLNPGKTIDDFYATVFDKVVAGVEKGPEHFDLATYQDIMAENAYEGAKIREERTRIAAGDALVSKALDEEIVATILNGDFKLEPKYKAGDGETYVLSVSNFKVELSHAEAMKFMDFQEAKLDLPDAEKAFTTYRKFLEQKHPDHFNAESIGEEVFNQIAARVNGITRTIDIDPMVVEGIKQFISPVDSFERADFMDRDGNLFAITGAGGHYEIANALGMRSVQEMLLKSGYLRLNPRGFGEYNINGTLLSEAQSGALMRYLKEAHDTRPEMRVMVDFIPGGDYLTPALEKSFQFYSWDDLWTRFSEFMPVGIDRDAAPIGPWKPNAEYVAKMEGITTKVNPKYWKLWSGDMTPWDYSQTPFVDSQGNFRMANTDLDGSARPGWSDGGNILYENGLNYEGVLKETGWVHIKISPEDHRIVIGVPEHYTDAQIKSIADKIGKYYKAKINPETGKPFNTLLFIEGKSSEILNSMPGGSKFGGTGTNVFDLANPYNDLKAAFERAQPTEYQLVNQKLRRETTTLPKKQIIENIKWDKENPKRNPNFNATDNSIQQIKSFDPEGNARIGLMSDNQLQSIGLNRQIALDNGWILTNFYPQSYDANLQRWNTGKIEITLGKEINENQLKEVAYYATKFNKTSTGVTELQIEFNNKIIRDNMPKTADEFMFSVKKMKDILDPTSHLLDNQGSYRQTYQVYHLDGSIMRKLNTMPKTLDIRKTGFVTQEGNLIDISIGGTNARNEHFDWIRKNFPQYWIPGDMGGTINAFMKATGAIRLSSSPFGDSAQFAIQSAGPLSQHQIKGIADGIMSTSYPGLIHITAEIDGDNKNISIYKATALDDLREGVFRKTTYGDSLMYQSYKQNAMEIAKSYGFTTAKETGAPNIPEEMHLLRAIKKYYPEKYGGMDVNQAMKEGVLYKMPPEDMVYALEERRIQKGDPPVFPTYRDDTKGSIAFGADGKATLKLFEAADISTVIHEFGHVIQRMMSDQHRYDSEAWLSSEVQRLNKMMADGKLTQEQIDSFFVDMRGNRLKQIELMDNGQWSYAANEIFSRAFERHLSDDNSIPVPKKIQAVFEAITQALRKVYNRITGQDYTGTPLDLNINLKVKTADGRMVSIKDVFDRMLHGENLAKGLEESKATLQSRPTGKTTFAFDPTDPNIKYQFQYKVVDLDELIPSNTDAFQPNENYPSVLQPRERGSKTSQKQVIDIAAGLVPEKVLIDVTNLADGTPIIGDDMAVEGGNGRVMGFRMARDSYPENWAKYRQYLVEHTAEFGIKPEDVEGIANPVLVRERMGLPEGIKDRGEFAFRTSKGSAAGFTPEEIAIQDATKWTPGLVSAIKVGETDSIDTALRMVSNKEIVNKFIQGLDDKTDIFTKDGQLSAKGIQRIKASLFAYTFDSDAGRKLLTLFTENVDNNIKTLENSIYANLPELAKMEGKIKAGTINADYSIAEDLARLIEEYGRRKREGIGIGQDDLFGSTSGADKKLIDFFYNNARSRKNIDAFIQEYLDLVNRQPAPDQISLIPMETISKETLLSMAVDHSDLNTGTYFPTDYDGTIVKLDKPYMNTTLKKMIDRQVVDADGNVVAEMPVKSKLQRIKTTNGESATVFGYDPDDPNRIVYYVNGEIRKTDPLTQEYKQVGFKPYRQVANPVGRVPPGSTPEMLDQGKLNSEANASILRPLIGDLRQKSIENFNNRPLKGIPVDAMPEPVKKVLDGYLNVAKSDMIISKNQAARMGTFYRDNALLNYSERYGIDNYTEMLFPYQFWFTRTAMNWLKRVMDRPMWLAMYANYEELRKKAQANGLPTRFNNMNRMYAPWLPAGFGGAVFADPIQQLFPLSQVTNIFKDINQAYGKQDNATKQVIEQQVRDNKISRADADKALEETSGNKIWDAAAEQATAENDYTQPYNLMSLAMSPAMWIDIPAKILGGNAKNITNLPMTRQGQAIGAALQDTPLQGVGNLAKTVMAGPETVIRKYLDLPEYSGWYDYYVSRSISNMAAEGLITANQASYAIAFKQGPAYDMGVKRTQQELSLKVPGMSLVYALKKGISLAEMPIALIESLFPGGILQEGELKYRGLYTEYQAAWSKFEQGDQSAINDFFKKYPEYETRLAIFQDPNTQMRNFITDKVWENYSKMSAANKKAAAQQLGQQFQEEFLGGRGKYDGIPTETLMYWAQFLGAKIPVVQSTAPKTAQPVAQPVQEYQPLAENVQITSKETADLWDPATNAAITEYERIKDRDYPNIDAIQSGYFAYPEGSPERKKYLNRFKQLKQFWGWKDDYRGKHPELEPYFAKKSMDFEATGQSPDYSNEVVSQMTPELVNQLSAYYYRNIPLAPGAYAELRYLWEQAGKPGGTLLKFIDNYVKPGFVQ